MKIMHVAAELAPIVKVGGLGDVVHGLSKALLKRGHTVEVVLPEYDTLDLSDLEFLKVVDNNHIVSFGQTHHTNTLWEGMIDGIPLLFIESHDANGYFERGKVYGCPDDNARFLYFCAAALSYLLKKGCDVVHLHDWHTAALAGLIKNTPTIEVQTVFTIHNFAYQGLCNEHDLEKLDWVDESLRDGESYNLLKGGIIYADQVTTVSPNYARELLTSDLGGSLQGTLKRHQTKFSGILNGIDYSYWNPQTDPHLPLHYSLRSLDKKGDVKEELKARLSLADEKSPLVCVVTRLVAQKGPELIKAALLRTLEWGGQFVLLGSALDQATHTQFYNLKRKLAGSAHVHLELTYNEALSHIVYAAGDLFLVPSLFEPCGLTQLIAMRYGTVPVVRRTGGLSDTVFDGKNGFTFTPFTVEGINTALDRAFQTWYEHPLKWRAMQLSGMEEDYSWERPAEEYLTVYNTTPPCQTKA